MVRVRWSDKDSPTTSNPGPMLADVAGTLMVKEEHCCSALAILSRVLKFEAQTEDTRVSYGNFGIIFFISPVGDSGSPLEESPKGMRSKERLNYPPPFERVKIIHEGRYREIKRSRKKENCECMYCTICKKVRLRILNDRELRDEMKGSDCTRN